MRTHKWVMHAKMGLAGVLLMSYAAVSGAEESLYQRIGEQSGIATVVDGFLAKVGADDRVNGRFAETDMPKLRALLVEQVCEATGGPCTYSGKSMLEAHEGMLITEAEFGIIAAHFAAAMVDSGVGTDDSATIMGVLAGKHGASPEVISRCWTAPKIRNQTAIDRHQIDAYCSAESAGVQGQPGTQSEFSSIIIVGYRTKASSVQVQRMCIHVT